MSLSIASRIESNVALAPRTTLQLGGAARSLLVAHNDDDILEALNWAKQQSLPVEFLGGGSNVVIADAGIDGLVVDLQSQGVTRTESQDGVSITAAAGQSWDALVAQCVSLGLAGVECLSGIPGRVGATPIQNVGAYGQEVGDSITSVRVLERSTGLIHVFDHAACGFGYRDSRFKAEPTRFVVLAVTFSLRRGDPAPARYAELQNALSAAPTLDQVRQTVIALRRAKSMVIDPTDDNRRSAGSFFTNPVVPTDQLADVVSRALSLGVIQQPSDLPTYPGGEGHTKLAAGWLVERAGFDKGLRDGAVGISSKHALSLVHHGGGSSSQLVELAQKIRDGVQQRFGVTLRAEPVFLGFAQPPL